MPFNRPALNRGRKERKKTPPGYGTPSGVRQAGLSTNRAWQDYFTIAHPFCQAQEGENVKIDLILPNGGEFHLERESKPPMDRERFNTLCGLAYALIAAAALIALFWILFGGR